MLPPLASIDDLEVRLTGPIGDGDVARAEACLADASNTIRSYAGIDWMEGDALGDVPDIIVTVTCRVAKRAFLNPEGYQQETTGDHTVMLRGDVLDDQDRLDIDSALTDDEDPGTVPGLSVVRVVAPRLAAGVPAPVPWWCDDDEETGS
jgi:hypothetical protein